MKDGSVCIHHRNIQLVAIEMFKVKNDLCPEIMKGIFKFHPSLKSGKDFLRPNVNKVYMGEGSLRWFGPIVWNNMLPEKLKTMSTMEEFKTEIKKWVPVNCPCRLCKEYLAGIGFVTLFD